MYYLHASLPQNQEVTRLPVLLGLEPPEDPNRRPNEVEGVRESGDEAVRFLDNSGRVSR